MAKITFADKVDNRVNSAPENQKFTAANATEVKTSVNALYDLLAGVEVVTRLVIIPANFAGDDYQNSKLVGLTPMVDFELFTNNGSGTLLKLNDGFTFNAGTGTITAPPDNYFLRIYTKLIPA